MQRVRLFSQRETDTFEKLTQDLVSLIQEIFEVAWVVCTRGTSIVIVI